MLHKIISTIGLGVLGVDPITAVYLMSMGLRKEKKSRITLFFLSFAGFSIFGGAALSAIFGATAVNFLKNIMPGDNSYFWAILNFGISIFIFVWVIRKLFAKGKKKEEEKEPIGGGWFKYITTGLVFAITSFTDPTFYAVILMSGESGDFFNATLLLTIWFIVSQFMAVIIYIANELNILDKLTVFVEKFKEKKLKTISHVFYFMLLSVTVALLVDTVFYLFNGKYLF